MFYGSNMCPIHVLINFSKHISWKFHSHVTFHEWTWIEVKKPYKSLPQVKRSRFWSPNFQFALLISEDLTLQNTSIAFTWIVKLDQVLLTCELMSQVNLRRNFITIFLSNRSYHYVWPTSEQLIIFMRNWCLLIICLFLYMLNIFP